MKYVYQVIIVNIEGDEIDSRFFSSHKAAKMFKSMAGRATCIVQHPVFTEKDVEV